MLDIWSDPVRNRPVDDLPEPDVRHLNVINQNRPKPNSNISLQLTYGKEIELLVNKH